jgi:hypothetical protein
MSSFSFTASVESGIVVTGGGNLITMEVIQVAGPQGPTGPSGQGTAVSLNFSWGDATPALIATIPAGKTVFKVEVILLVAFDVASTLTVGDAGNVQRLVDITDSDLTQTGGYQVNPNFLYNSLTDVNLYLTPGVGNTQGSGLILLYIQE